MALMGRKIECGLTRQVVEQFSESWHTALQVFQPSGGMPNLDADGRADDGQVGVGFGPQKLAKSFGNEQAPSAGQLGRLVTRGEQAAEQLHLSGSLVQSSSLKLAPHQFHSLVQLRLPYVGQPKA